MINNSFSVDTSIDLLALSPPAYNALMRAGIRKIGDIAALTQEELTSIRNFPFASVKDIREILCECGLSFSPQSTGGIAQFQLPPVESEYSGGFYIPTSESVVKADAWLSLDVNYDYLRRVASEHGVSLCYLAGKLPHFLDILKTHQEGEEHLRTRLRKYAQELAQTVE